jgi:hypothetical protein
MGMLPSPCATVVSTVTEWCTGGHEPARDVDMLLGAGAASTAALVGREKMHVLAESVRLHHAERDDHDALLEQLVHERLFHDALVGEDDIGQARGRGDLERLCVVLVAGRERDEERELAVDDGSVEVAPRGCVVEGWFAGTFTYRVALL